MQVIGRFSVATHAPVDPQWVLVRPCRSVGLAPVAYAGLFAGTCESQWTMSPGARCCAAGFLPWKSRPVLAPSSGYRQRQRHESLFRMARVVESHAALEPAPASSRTSITHACPAALYIPDCSPPQPLFVCLSALTLNSLPSHRLAPHCHTISPSLAATLTTSD